MHAHDPKRTLRRVGFFSAVTAHLAVYCLALLAFVVVDHFTCFFAAPMAEYDRELSLRFRETFASHGMMGGTMREANGDVNVV